MSDYEFDTACRVLFGTCSDDRVELFHGAPASTVVCGRHAGSLDADDYRIMYGGSPTWPTAGKLRSADA